MCVYVCKCMSEGERDLKRDEGRQVLDSHG